MNMKALGFLLIVLMASGNALSQEVAQGGALTDQQKIAQIESISSEKLDAKNCSEILKISRTIAHPAVQECKNLEKLAMATSLGGFEQVNVKESLQQSMDGKIRCIQKASYTYDYDACVQAITYYNSVIAADATLNVTQKIQTDLKNNSIEKKATQQAAQGDAQTGMFDAAIESNKHQKSMQEQKMYAYGAAVAALGRALWMIPGKSDALKVCGGETCDPTLQKHKPYVLANQDAKTALGIAMAEFTAKAAAAGIAMGQYQTSANQIQQAKQPYIEDQNTEMMMERCAFNPTDPACAKPGNRVAGTSGFGQGEFSLGGEGANNAFNMNPEDSTFGEVGAATNIDDKNEVASINSPFADEAKMAKDIVDPAGAAQMQAGNGAQGGGGGGAGGGGGGSASLGQDLQGADKEGDKEAQIKAGKVSGVYGATGGGGYKGVAKGKENANPFASLFDQKSNGGGIEEDRSIASGDIDGKASGLFLKISKRYTQIHADKRIEAKNLE